MPYDALIIMIDISTNQMTIADDVFIHPTSIVDQDCDIDTKTKIWHWVHVTSGARIGKNCSLGQNVYVGSKAVLGDNVKVQNNVSIYDNVILENDVFCGPSMVFTNVYNPRSAIQRKDEYRTTIVKKGATIGANSTIVCGVTIGESAFIGAGSLINKDVKAYALVVGVPGRQIGWMSAFGERIPLPLQGNESWKCPHTETIYRLQESALTTVPN